MSEAVGNLPVHLSDFIGREGEANEVRKLLSDHRLVTLTGPGGSGKTRLSIKVANELLRGFEQGVWFIRFAPLTDSGLVSQAVASTLGIGETRNQPIVDGLIEHLKDYQSLLIFDNCEHLIDACAQLAEKLLQTCPKIKILATSREPLSIPSEVTWVIPPMSTPVRQPWRDPKSGKKALSVYRESESVQLFLNRAALVIPDFELTMDNGAWVAEICRRLDGMPLAIELAAVRVRVLSVQQIAERLDDRFNLLTGRNRTVPARHQTLSATLDWSYDLLSNTECKVLQRLSVFSGGATLDAVEAICARDGVEASGVLERLSQLVDKSFVVADRGASEMRYFLLETIRQYAYGKLLESGESNKTKDRHLNYFVEWAEMANSNLERQDQLLWLDRFETEHDNLRAALEWSNTNKNSIGAGLRLAAACGTFWRFHSHISEGREHFSAVLSHTGIQERTSSRASALLQAGALAYKQSDYSAVELLAKKALSIWRELGAAGRQGAAMSLELLGELASEVGDYEAMFTHFQQGLDLYRELDDTRGIGGMLMQIGWASMRVGDLQEAKKYLEECKSIFQTLGAQRDLGFTYSGLGEVAIRLGEYDRAASLFEQGLSLGHQIGDKWLIAAMLGSLGWAALNQDNLMEMRKVLRESLALRTELGDQGGIAWCLEKLAKASYVEREYKKTAKIFGAAAALRAPLNSVIDEADLPEYNRLIADLKSALGEKAFDAAWTEGQAKPLEDVIEEALAAPKTTRQMDKEKYGGLSPREREVAVLIAEGKTNREIAEEMSVTPKTVETYVTRILNKLSFDSRVQIATWALGKRLK